MGTKKRPRSKKDITVAAAHQSPAIKPLVPEIRSDLKWKPSKSAPTPFAVPGTALVVMAVWSYGVPFGEVQDFHNWLGTNESGLAGLLQSAMAKKGPKDPKVFYLGTYLNIRNGTPMYQTYWGYTSEDGLENDTAWPDPLPQNLRDLIVDLRAFWARDPGRSESRFALASHYELDPQQNRVMARITFDAAKKRTP